MIILRYLPEFRYESPISISKLNNHSDFRPKSENYSKVKVFSDSRPKSAQKLILKVFSDFPTQIICRLSKIFKFLICWYTRARMAFMVASLLRDRKSVRLSEETVRWSLYGRIYGFWSLGTPFVCPCFGRLKIWSMLIYSVRVT